MKGVNSYQTKIYIKNMFVLFHLLKINFYKTKHVIIQTQCQNKGCYYFIIT